MSRTPRAFAVTAAVSLLALAACSGGGGGSGAGAAKDAVNGFGRTGSCKLLTVAARRELAGESSVTACQRVLDEGAKPKYSIERASISGSRATVHVKGTEGAYTIRLAKADGAWLIDHVDQPRQSDTPSTSAAPAADQSGAGIGVPVTDAAATRDALLRAARSASYDPSLPDLTDAVFNAWKASDPSLQLTNSVTDATPTQVSEHSGFAMDKTSGDLVFAFTVMDTANRCAAGAVAIPSSAAANDSSSLTYDCA